VVVELEETSARTSEIGNVEKGAIFEKLRFSIINLTIKKLPKLDELGIER
jgi:hypothetical protein